MAARANASGTISFGLVSIPVKIYAASQTKSVRFNMLHANDHSRLKQQYVCSTCGDVVDRADTVKGYEYSRGQYIVMQEDELKALEQNSDRTIEIEEFIPISQVDPVFFAKSQLLGPDKGGAKAYQLLALAMRESGKVALGRFATRGKHELVLLRPTAEGLMMHGLLYADEVRNFDDVDLGDEVVLKDGELDLAMQLIDQLSTDRFDPGRYEDGYRKAVLEVVDRKVAGEEIVAVPEPQQREQIIDLVAALKRSIAEKRAGAAKAPAAAGRARKAAKAKGTKAAAGRKRSSG